MGVDSLIWRMPLHSQRWLLAGTCPRRTRRSSPRTASIGGCTTRPPATRRVTSASGALAAAAAAVVTVVVVVVVVVLCMCVYVCVCVCVCGGGVVCTRAFAVRGQRTRP